MRSGFWAWSSSEAGANPRWLSPVHPRPCRGPALGTFLPPLTRPPTDPNRSRPNVRSACVRRNGVVRGSMGEVEEAGISFFVLPPLHRVIPALNWDPVSGSAAAYASNYGVYWVSGRARDDEWGEDRA